jgi:segregation and condensation protein B
VTDEQDPKTPPAVDAVPAEEPLKNEGAPQAEAPATEADPDACGTAEQGEAGPKEGDAPPAECADAETPAEDAAVPADAETPAEGADASAEGEPAEGEKPSKKKREPKPACPERQREEPPDLVRRIEAILFATDQPLSPRRIAEALEITEGRVKEVVAALREHYDADARAFTVEEIAGGFQIMTRSDFGGVVKKLFEVEREHKLSPAALETLAIIAYKQPIIRAEVEDIRGVQVQPILKTLQEQGLVRIVGRAEQLGRPMLYGTTQKFLVTFGLNRPKTCRPSRS